MNTRGNRARLAGALCIAALVSVARGKPAVRTRVRSLALESLIRVTAVVDRRWGWDPLPFPLGLLTLIGLREALRDRNYFAALGFQPKQTETPASNLRYTNARTPDGSFNNLEWPLAGKAGTRFIGHKISSGG